MYKLITNSTGIQRVEDGAFIPPDPLNADWQQYQDWLAQGNSPDATDQPAPAKTPLTLIEQLLADPAAVAELKQKLGLA